MLHLCLLKFQLENSIPLGKKNTVINIFLDSPPTDNIQLVGMIDAPILVFHHTGIVSLVGGHYRFHDDGPNMVANLSIGEKGFKGSWT